MGYWGQVSKGLLIRDVDLTYESNVGKGLETEATKRLRVVTADSICLVGVGNRVHDTCTARVWG